MQASSSTKHSSEVIPMSREEALGILNKYKESNLISLNYLEQKKKSEGLEYAEKKSLEFE